MVGITGGSGARGYGPHLVGALVALVGDFLVGYYHVTDLVASLLPVGTGVG